MQSVRVKWNISTLEYWELTINDVLGEVGRAVGKPPCEARGELHSVAPVYIWPTSREVRLSESGPHPIFAQPMAPTAMLFGTLGVRQSMRKELLSPVRWATGVDGHKQDRIHFYCEKFGAEVLENLPLSHPPV
jgi:hypothetical protein